MRIPAVGGFALENATVRNSAPMERDMSLPVRLLFHLSKKRVLNSKPGDAAGNPATFDATSYQEWRDSELRKQFLENFDPAELRGKDVLDFGCGSGDLSFLMAGFGPKSVTGIELNADLLHSAAARAEGESSAVPLNFIVGSNSKAIDLPDASMDVIVCFDVLEHILDYCEIIPEWRRVLRPGGKVFIWWVPWFHPYGHHIQTLVPLPWVHCFVPERVLTEVCARIYDMPEFKPRLWDQDENGNKRSNKWLHFKSLPDVNRLTIGRFQRVCKKAGIGIEYRKTAGFEATRLAGLTGMMSRIPLLREFFCSHVVYRLKKPEVS